MALPTREDMTREGVVVMASLGQNLKWLISHDCFLMNVERSDEQSRQSCDLTARFAENSS